MEKAKSVSGALSVIVRKLINKNQGLGRVFGYARKLKEFNYIPDIGLFRFIVIEFRSLGKKLDNKSINYHFNTRVSKDDYEGVSKREIFKDLYNSRH